MIIDIIRTTKTIEVRIGPRGRPGADGSSAWADITGKPSTFPPSSHTHAQSEITGLEAALAGKAAASHTHAIGNVTGLQTALDGKAASSHTHNQGDITGLTSALAAKADLVDGMVPTSQIPAIAITEFLGTVANQSAMLALTGQRGDWCNRSDVSKAFVLVAEPASTLSNWAPIDYPAAPILSVNGQTGTVVLGKDDIGLGNVANALQLIAANNLSDLTNAATARVNLGLGNVANIDTTNASNITSGTLSTDRLNASSGGLGFNDAGKIVKFNAFGNIDITIGTFVRTPGGGTANPQAFYGFDQQVYYQAGGQVTVLPATLTGTRTITLPDRTGTLITDADTATVTNAMLAGSIALSKLSLTGAPDGTKFLRDDGSWQAINLSGYATTGANTFTGAQTLPNSVTLNGVAAGTLQLGVNHASSPTAQVIKAHDVTTGTGASLTLTGGTGSSAGGAVNLATSTTSGAPVVRLSALANGTVTIGATSAGYLLCSSNTITGGFGGSTSGRPILNMASGLGSSIFATVGGISGNDCFGISPAGGAANVNLFGVFTSNTAFTFTLGAGNKDFNGAYTGAGHTTAVVGGRGSSVTTGGAGGALTLTGGAAAGSGNNNGGDVVITGGAPTGTGTRGNVRITNLPTSSAGLPTGSLWNDAGTVKVA